MKKLIALIALTAASILCMADNTNQTSEAAAPPGTNETTQVEINTDVAVETTIPSPPSEITWQAEDATLKFIVRTNSEVNWVNLEKFEEMRARQPVWRVKQIGIVNTNRILSVIQEGRSTNEIVLKVLHKGEWPSTNRTVYAPRK